MSRLEGESVGFRNKLIAKNDYNYNEEYNVGNPDALSTGDEQGKGELNGSVGGATDIKQREKLIAKNKYNYNKEYNDATA
jgi:hypothetical protein